MKGQELLQGSYQSSSNNGIIKIGYFSNIMCVNIFNLQLKNGE